jgi:hypothetical protein
MEQSHALGIGGSRRADFSGACRICPCGHRHAAQGSGRGFREAQVFKCKC